MATSYVTIGSKFRPFSYDELVRPLQEATVAHQALETEYADLDTKASVWENIANEQTDPKAYQMYKRYSEDLKSQADALASQGLTQVSRQNLLKMKGRYSQEITPIEQAYTRRRQLADEQRKALAENPTLMYQRDASTMSLDDFIANPEIDYGASYSGAVLAKQAGDMASNLAKSMRSDPRKWEHILGGQYWQTMEKSGYTPEEIVLASQFNKDAPEELRNIMKQVYESSGIDSWADNSTKKRAIDYITSGLYNAIGTTKYDTLQDRNFLSPYERWKMRKKETSDSQQPIFYDYVGTELNIDRDANAKQLNEYLKNLRAYKDSIDRGETVSPYTSRMGYANGVLDDKAKRIESYIARRQEENPQWNPDTDIGLKNLQADLQRSLDSYAMAGRSAPKMDKEYRTENPVYNSYTNLSKQYGTDDIDSLIKEQELSLKKAVSVNKYAKFKTAQSDLAMRELRAALLSGIEDRSDKKEVRKRIHKLGDSKAAPDEDTLSKIFNDSAATIQFNPVTGKSIIEGSYGSYEIDGSAAFHNIGVPTPVGVIPGDEFLRMITNFAQSSQYDTSSREAGMAMDNMLNTFYGALYNSYNGAAPEAPKTSAKVSTFPL